MARKFSDLEAKMSPERLAMTDTLAEEIIAEMNLANMRQSRGLSQSDLADALDVRQPARLRKE
jgi:DNA-binding XRE family transcriptional regulator